MWPFTPGGSEYCPVPDAWSLNVSWGNVWEAKYPLVHIIIDSNATSIEDMFQLIDAHFCSFGYTFIILAVTGYLLALLSLGALLALVRALPGTHLHRKLLFFLLFGVGMVRGVYNHLCCLKIATVRTYSDTIPIMPWFFDTTVPVNGLGDLLTAYVDLLLTFYWLQFVAPVFCRSRLGQATPVILAVFSASVGVIVFMNDYNQVADDGDYNQGFVYQATLGYLTGLLLCSAMLHAVVVCMLLRQLLLTRDYVAHLSGRMRRHMLVVGLIGLVSVLCGVLRGVTLAGHIAKSSEFLDGAISFDNPTMTTVYYVAFMNVPCIVVGVAFFVLSLELLSGEEDVVTGSAVWDEDESGPPTSGGRRHGGVNGGGDGGGGGESQVSFRSSIGGDGALSPYDPLNPSGLGGAAAPTEHQLGLPTGGGLPTSGTSSRSNRNIPSSGRITTNMVRNVTTFYQNQQQSHQHAFGQHNQQQQHQPSQQQQRPRNAFGPRAPLIHPSAQQHGSARRFGTRRSGSTTVGSYAAPMLPRDGPSSSVAATNASHHNSGTDEDDDVDGRGHAGEEEQEPQQQRRSYGSNDDDDDGGQR